MYPILCLTVFLIGLYGVATKKDLLKMILGLVIMEYALYLFLVMSGHLPEILVLVTMVIGLATLLVVIALALRLFSQYKTFDISQIRKLRG